MVLEDVAQHAGLLVVAGAVPDADRLGHGDLHVVDVVAVPQRLEDGVGEAKDQDVLDRLFAQVVVDAVDLALVEDLVHLAVERLRAGQVAAERLLDDDAHEAGCCGAARGGCQSGLSLLRPVGHDHRVELRRRGQVEQVVAARVACVIQLGPSAGQRGVGRRVVVVALAVVEVAGEPRPAASSGLPAARTARPLA